MLLHKTLRSSTLKLALICIGLFGGAIVGLFAYVYWSTTNYVHGRADRIIAAEYDMLRRAYDEGGRGNVADKIARLLADRPFIGHFYLLTDHALASQAGNLSSWPELLGAGEGWGEFTTAVSQQDGLRRARFGTLPNGDHLLVARDIDDLDQFVRTIKTALLFSLAVIFSLVGVAALAVTRRTVGRIESINALSRAIMDSGLDMRIRVRGTRDEWDQLAENLNLMLDRIEALMREVKQATDNVAHDLRTPLTRIRTRLEKASNAPRSAAADRDLIHDTLADLDGVLRMFSALTRISQIETSDRTAAFRNVNLADVAHEVAELFDAAAEEKGTCLEVVGEPSVVVTGDRDLLFDALANLVDNAIKHGREAGRVSVAVRIGETEASASVIDDGPGIPPDEFPHVFKRFYRLERSRRTPGNGLGLSLVAAVARLHGARIEMIDNAPGLTFCLRFPLAVQAARDDSATGSQASSEPRAA